MIKKVLNNTWLLFLIIFVIGVFLRIYNFPNIPAGINQDEAAAAYEAYSILETGKDKWGNPFPMYFPAWGSGQNALYIYILVPFIKIFGFNSFALRLPSLIIGILTIILVFLVTRKAYNSKVALIATFLLSILPMHIMMSRWALESNILPFTFLLGVLLLQYSFNSNQRKWLIIFCLIPFAFSLYAYSLSLFIVPAFLALIFWFHKSEIIKNRKYWISSFSVFLLLASPIFLFILKNNVLNNSLGIEQFLPFSIPLFPSSRLSQAAEKPFLEQLGNNFSFLTNGFNDFSAWNTAEPYLPLSPFIYLFLVISLIKNLKDLKQKKLNLFVGILIPYLLVFFLVLLNVNRFNLGLFAILILSSEGIAIFIQMLQKYFNFKEKAKVNIFFGIITLFIIYSISFTNYYFNSYPIKSLDAFNIGIKETINFAVKQSNETQKVYLSSRAPINYIQYLYYTNANPLEFQQEAKVEIYDGGYNVNQFKNFYFVEKYFRKEIQISESYLVIQKLSEDDFCISQNELYRYASWKVSECFLRSE